VGPVGRLPPPRPPLGSAEVVFFLVEFCYRLFPQTLFPSTPAAGRPQPAVSEGSNGGGITALICVITILDVAALSKGSAGFFFISHIIHT